MAEIPLRGDRSAWDNIDYPQLHARDLDTNSPLHHLPTPTSGSGKNYELYWDGSKWSAVEATSGSGSSGSGSSLDIEFVYGEDITDQVPLASLSDYILIHETFVSGSLRVYYNGLRQRKIYYTEYPNDGKFTLSFATHADDELIVDYNILTSQEVSGGWGDGEWGNISW